MTLNHLSSIAGHAKPRGTLRTARLRLWTLREHERTSPTFWSALFVNSYWSMSMAIGACHHKPAFPNTCEQIALLAQTFFATHDFLVFIWLRCFLTSYILRWIMEAAVAGVARGYIGGLIGDQPGYRGIGEVIRSKLHRLYIKCIQRFTWCLLHGIHCCRMHATSLSASGLR